MLQIESNTVIVQKSTEELYTFLSSSFANYQKIMPDDVSTFEADETSFVFGLNGLPEIRLIEKEKIAPQKIVLTAASSKLNFDLACVMEPAGEGTTQAKFEFEGDFNAMMTMMIKNPLQNFINKLAENLAKL
jgi:hypothetical protein